MSKKLAILELEQLTDGWMLHQPVIVTFMSTSSLANNETKIPLQSYYNTYFFNKQRIY